MRKIYEIGEKVKMSHEGKIWELTIESVEVEKELVWYRFQTNPSNRFSKEHQEINFFGLWIDGTTT